jgi:hypothetical protein
MDGQLSERERARVQAHLNACSDCRAELHTLRWTRDLTQQMPVLPVPRSFIVREADLEPATSARPALRLSRSLASLQAAAAIIAVLLVLVVAGDVFVGNGFPQILPAPGPAEQPAVSMLQESKTVTMSVQTFTENPPGDRAVVEEPAQEPDVELEIGAASVTATDVPAAAPMAETTATRADPTPEPSPTWTTWPTHTPTPPGFPGETSTKRSPTPQTTVTTAPTFTATNEPTPTAEPTPTPEPSPTAEPTWTFTPASMPEPTKVAGVPDAPPTEQIESGGIKPETVGDQPKLGWKVVQAGLGLILAGLLIAIIWLRLKERAG